MGEGFINWGYIVVEKHSMLDMKGLSFSMPRLFDYLGYMTCLRHAQFFQLFFQVLLVHPWTTMDAQGIVLRLKMRVQIRNNTFRRQPLYPLSYWGVKTGVRARDRTPGD